MEGQGQEQRRGPYTTMNRMGVSNRTDDVEKWGTNWHIGTFKAEEC